MLGLPVDIHGNYMKRHEVLALPIPPRIDRMWFYDQDRKRPLDCHFALIFDRKNCLWFKPIDKRTNVGD
jgi:hypothetical protein